MPGSTTDARRSICSATDFVLLRLGANGRPMRPRWLTPPRRAAFRMREIAIRRPGVAALYETSLVLVRPDGHVAWRGNECPADAGAIVDRVRGAGDMDKPHRNALVSRQERLWRTT